jgi:hypothetical protein
VVSTRPYVCSLVGRCGRCPPSWPVGVHTPLGVAAKFPMEDSQERAWTVSTLRSGCRCWGSSRGVAVDWANREVGGEYAGCSDRTSNSALCCSSWAAGAHGGGGVCSVPAAGMPQ